MHSPAARQGELRVSADPIIRQGREGDLARVLAIERAAATAPHWSEAAHAQALNRKERCLLVAEVRGRVAGFAVVAALTNPAELESVVVEAEERGHGVGTALCRAVLAWCGARRIATVELEVRAASRSARRVYERVGFFEVARRPNYYAEPGDDAVLMRAMVPRVDPVELD